MIFYKGARGQGVKFISSHFWSLEVQDQGDSVSASDESSLPGLQMAIF